MSWLRQIVFLRRIDRDLADEITASLAGALRGE